MWYMVLIDRPRPPGRPRSSFNDVAFRDCPNCQIGRPYRQTALERQDVPCTYLAHHDLESVIIIITIDIRLVGTIRHSRHLCGHSSSPQWQAVSAAAKHVTSSTLCMLCDVRQPLTRTGEMES